MCGIVGYVGSRPALKVVLQGLERLEYRGYDSAGVALGFVDGIRIRKHEGRLSQIEALLKPEEKVLQASQIGIGHTRWATHGKPTTQNAHPHRVGSVVLVHNGIIENFLTIREELKTRALTPQSETDSELLGYLVEDAYLAGAKSLREATSMAMKKIEGACSAVLMDEREPDVIVAVRQGSPLVAARDPEGGVFLASDAQPILPYTNEVLFLEDGDLLEARAQGFQIWSLPTQTPVERVPQKLEWSVEKLDRGGFPHYMLKEIYEQPTALVDTLSSLTDRRTSERSFMMPIPPLTHADELVIAACGTSWHAAMVGRYWLEEWSGLRVNVELASELRYRTFSSRPRLVLMGMSQSGETADTLAVIREAKRLGIPTLGITNVRGSTLSREAGLTYFTGAGPEIGVAATKTFLTQMLGLYIMSGSRLAAKVEKESVRRAQMLEEALLRLPHQLRDWMEPTSRKFEGVSLQEHISQIAERFQEMRGFFFMGRGTSYPLALEGALKLKEIAYLHAEGYAAGELKHGPIAMLDPSMTVVVLAPKDRWRDKTVSNLQEVKARGAHILAIGSEGDAELESLSDAWIAIPPGVPESLQPFFLAPALQLFSYELACLKGTDVDRPRNLAKSVTVE
jgi:glucosamine--fructose-6-phosphate aminotransferase (isomerizing)